ncbi:MAG: apolipoprotein N-acyltransferase [Rhodospirillaceae bacterium]|nr:MAG: apolipoprotein N-acyltransferase [Rhodospirillaceae bacterium]
MAFLKSLSLERGGMRRVGGRRHALAVVLGGLAAAALPPVEAVPVLVVAFSGLVWLLDGGKPGAFAVGWWFGVGFFGAGLYWVAHALLIEPRQFAWMIPLAVSALAGGLAVFTGLATWLTVKVSRPGVGRVVALAGAWTVSEMARGTLFSGFPWNLVAYAWTGTEAMMQTGAVVGAYGVSLLTVLMAAAPAAVIGAPRGKRWPGAALLVLVPFMWGAGTVRLNEAGPVATVPRVEGVMLRLVQPNTPQSLRWVPERRAQHFRQHLAMSVMPGFEQVTHVIWPETASAFSLDWHEEARRLVAKAAPPGGAVLTGVLRTTPPGYTPARFWNSLMAIDHEGSVVATYDKAHLVPFGEYVPLRNMLPLPRIIIGSTDFSPGPGLQKMSVPGLPVLSPLICYEVVFPGSVVEYSGRPQWMLNITNDAWFGLSAGPYQHFASARWRAVEEGVPLVRVAVTGISGVVDPYGRVVKSLGLGVMGIEDTFLPAALSKAPPFARWGNALAGILAIGCLGTALMSWRRKPFDQGVTPSSL